MGSLSQSALRTDPLLPGTGVQLAAGTAVDDGGGERIATALSVRLFPLDVPWTKVQTGRVSERGTSGRRVRDTRPLPEPELRASGAGRVVLILLGAFLLSAPDISFLMGAEQASVLAPISAAYAASSSTSAATGYFEALDDSLSGLSLDPGRVAPVRGFVFERDGAGISLDDGLLYACEPVGGRTRSFVFEGAGRFVYRPPIAVEQEQLRRVRGETSVDLSFDRMFLFFGDHTPAQMLRAFPFASGEISKTADKFMHSAAGYLPTDPMRQAVLDGSFTDYFYVQTEGGNGDTYCFEVDPLSAEEVTLSVDETKFVDEWTPITMHHRPVDYAASLQESYEDVLRFEIPHYDLSLDIESGLDLEAQADLTVRFRSDGVGWIRLLLHPDLELDEARWDGGPPVLFGREKDEPTIWISTSRSVEGAAAEMPAASEERHLHLRYHGDVIERGGNWITLKSSTGWYPRSGSRIPSTFDLTYVYPSSMSLVSVGRNSGEETKDGKTTSRWSIATPTRNVTFGLGFFDEYVIEDERIPPVTVHYSTKHHGEISRALIEEGITSGKDMEKRVAADVANSLAFYQTLLGPCRADRIEVVESPTGHGEAFTGLIQLSWATFQGEDEDGASETFRAHEIAHQWWGTGVDFVSYHDQWLSEAFSEYSALWFLQSGLGEPETFFRRLRDSRDEIFGNRKYLVGSGQESGPIWLGYRNDTEDTAGDYDLIVYQKGAWVLHMLRNLLLDINTMDESLFTGLLRDFHTKYGGKRVDIRLHPVEARAGAPLDWFFDQWVFGTDLPEYTFSWKSVRDGDAQYLVTVRVEQSGVPDTFRTYMPILIDFGGGRHARLRVHLTGEHAEITLPPLPAEPVDIHFNDLESVLCRVDVVDWKD
ncbi:MAG: M1 family aminopeptidase [Candidatus Eisenbacteria bacterium]